MIDFRLERYALGVCAAIAVLAGCGGSQPAPRCVWRNASPRATGEGAPQNIRLRWASTIF